MEALERLRELAGINRAIISSLDYGEVLHRVVQKTAAFTGADACLLLLTDAANQAHVAASVNVDPERARTFRAPFDAEIYAVLGERLGLAAAESFLGVPVVKHGQVAGALAVHWHGHGPPSGEEELLLSALADQAALALEQAELFRKLQQANQRKDEFLATLAHELRNPLGAMSNAVHLLKRHAAEAPRLGRAVETLERQVHHQVRLIDDLLDVSRITRGKITLHSQRLDLGWLLRQASEDHRADLEGAGITLNLELPETPLWISGDATRLAQVVSNLLSNAVKFTSPGGQVTVGCRTEGEGWSAPNSDPAADGQHPPPAAVVTVRDTGIGIDPELLPHLFQSFAQGEQSLDRSGGGLGLGLALVKGLVELHGGWVWAASAGPGRGAEFAFALPLAESVDAPTGAGSSAPPRGETRSPAPKRILLVEDNPDAAETLRVALELLGHSVTVAASGPAGVEKARELRPEVVLCDIGLPGMDGYTVAGILRRDPGTAGARLIAMSGYGRAEDHRRSHAAGFEQHLVKPVNFAALQRLLASAPEHQPG